MANKFIPLELRSRLEASAEELRAKGELLSPEKLDSCYAIFRERFGPEVLAKLDGEELLNFIHLHGNKDSLVYWLEFKNDEELPAQFGSIAGGSALKFGIYFRKETGEWMTGSPRVQTKLTVPEAVAVARKHRDQLIACSALVAQLPLGATDGEYYSLQDAITKAGPDLADTAWGHKYLSLLHATKLDDFHNASFQRFHLVKLFQVPPDYPGRFVCAGRFVAMARELGLRVQQFTRILNEVNGKPHRYWRLSTRPNGAANMWDTMRTSGKVFAGWPKVGDLSSLSANVAGKELLRKQLEGLGTSADELPAETQQLFNFAKSISVGDVVLAADGSKVVGIGHVMSDYKYDASHESPAPHFRSVSWEWSGQWQLPATEGETRLVHELKNRPENLVAIERQLLAEHPPGAKDDEPLGGTLLEGVPGRVQSVLDRKGQVLVYGPPGTGKTYWAVAAAKDLASISAGGVRYAQLSDELKRIVDGDEVRPGLVRFCTFHPAYGYEDFIEGYRPNTIQSGLTFERKDGLFKRICEDAEAHRQHKYYLVVDEINRGDIPRIFGELITLLELNKRGMKVELPMSGHKFSVPPNVFIIGTMNTADRSIALLDTALRRRFGFVELMPDPSVLGSQILGKVLPLGPWLSALNDRIRDHVGRDSRNLQVGHAYFMKADGAAISNEEEFVHILFEDIVPLLEEYCYGDYATLAQILGEALVDQQRQRVRIELSEYARREELLNALLSPAPEIATSLETVVAMAEESNEEPTSSDDASSDALSGAET